MNFFCWKFLFIRNIYRRNSPCHQTVQACGEIIPEINRNVWEYVEQRLYYCLEVNESQFKHSLIKTYLGNFLFDLFTDITFHINFNTKQNMSAYLKKKNRKTFGMLRSQLLQGQLELDRYIKDQSVPFKSKSRNLF